MLTRMILAVCFTSLYSVVLWGQTPFSGAGINSQPFGGSTGIVPARTKGNKDTMFGTRPQNSKDEKDSKFVWPWNRGDKNADKPTGGMFAERPSWLPEANDSNEEPDILDRAMKPETKSMWARTNENMQNWAQRSQESIRETNQRIMDSTRNTWENMTSKLPPPPWAQGNKKESLPAKPPLRSASDWINQPKQKFK